MFSIGELTTLGNLYKVLAKSQIKSKYSTLANSDDELPAIMSTSDPMPTSRFASKVARISTKIPTQELIGMYGSPQDGNAK